MYLPTLEETSTVTHILKTEEVEDESVTVQSRRWLAHL